MITKLRSEVTGVKNDSWSKEKGLGMGAPGNTDNWETSEEEEQGGGKKPGGHSRRGSMRRNQKNEDVLGDRATLISIRQRGQEIHSGELRQL